eukprot:gene10682-11852_t
MNLSVNDQPEEEENREASMSQEDLFKELRIRSLGPVQLSASLQVKGWLLAACSLAYALAFLYASILSKMGAAHGTHHLPQLAGHEPLPAELDVDLASSNESFHIQDG